MPVSKYWRKMLVYGYLKNAATTVREKYCLHGNVAAAAPKACVSRTPLLSWPGATHGCPVQFLQALERHLLVVRWRFNAVPK